MLYDGAIGALASAHAAASRGDLRVRAEGVSKAMAIICELQNTLNVRDGGQIATQLDSLYAYMMNRLLESTMKKDVGAIGEVQRLLTTLRDGWNQIANQPMLERATA